MKLNRRYYRYLIVAFLAFVSLSIGVFYIAIASIQLNKSAIEKKLSQMLDLPVTIQSLQLDWFGFSPQIALEQVSVSKAGVQDPILSAQQVKVKINLFHAIVHKQIYLQKLVLQQPHFTLRWNGVDRFSIEGVGQGQSLLPKQLLKVDRFIIQEGVIQFKGQNALAFPMRDVQLKMTNGMHGLRLSASGEAVGKTPLFFKLKNHIASQDQAMVLSLKADQFQDWNQLFEQVGLKIDSGQGSIQLSAKKQLGQFTSGDCLVHLHDLKLAAHKILPSTLAIKHWQGHYTWHSARKDVWQLKGDQTIQILADQRADKGQFNLMVNPKQVRLEATQFNIETVMPILEKAFSNKIKQIKPFKLQGLIQQLALRYQRQAQKGSLDLKTIDTQFDFRSLFRAPITVDKLKTTIEFEKMMHGWRIQTHQPVSVKQQKAKAEVSLLLILEENQSPQIQITGHLEHLNSNQIHAFMPVGCFKPKLRAWLDQSLKGGNLEQGQLVLKGRLSDFPFNQPNQTGEYRWSLDFSDLDLKYHPAWPEINNIAGRIVVEKETLGIQVQSADILSEPVESIRATIEPLKTDKLPFIQVAGRIHSNLETGLLFLNQSPLAKTVGHALKSIQPKGKMELDLDLTIPLVHNQSPKVVGKLDLKDAKVAVPIGQTLSLTNLAGQLRFTQADIQSTPLSFELFDQKSTGALFTEKIKGKRYICFKMNGHLQAETLKAMMPTSWLPYIQGETNYAAVLKSAYLDDLKQTTLSFSSDLQGIVLKLPKPFFKARKTKKRFEAQLALFKDQDQILTFSLAKQCRGQLRFNQQHQIQGGQIVLGNLPLRSNVPEDKLFVQGSLEAVNWLDWKPYLSQVQNKLSSVPIEYDVFAKQINFLDLMFSNVTFGFKPYEDAKIISLKSDLLTGEILLPVGEQSQVSLILDYLKLPYQKASTVFSKNTRFSKSVLKSLPDLQIVCDKLYWHEKSLGALKLHLISKKTGYQIGDSRLFAPFYTVKFNGDWSFEQSATLALSGHVETTNLGRLLGRVQKQTAFIGGHGDVHFDLVWPGTLNDLKWMNMQGKLSVDLKTGQLKGVDSGMARILGLFNLDNLQRRLRFDFKDVTDKAFSYDKLAGDLMFENKQANTQDFLIDGPSAKILLNGALGLENETLNLHMRVTPKMGTTIPMAAAIAVGNPAVGAAFWLLDKMSGSKISQIAHYQYYVTGSWDTPIVKEMKKIDQSSQSS